MHSRQKHGGTRRSEQIYEVISTLSPQVFTCQEVGRLSLDIPVLVRLTVRAMWLFASRGLSLRGAANYIRIGAALLPALRCNKPDIVIYEVGVGVISLVSDILQRGRLRYWAFPQNIEFLVPDQIDPIFRSQLHAFAWEVETYRRADRTLTISELDKAVLQCLGVTAECFPYYPPKEVHAFLQSIALQRTDSTRRHILVLGSVTNPPTRLGIESLLRSLRDGPVTDYDVRVAGHGTEQLRHLASPRIEICGEVSMDRLRELLVGCVYVLLRQSQSSGFATRLVEMNLSHIPVIVVGEYAQANNLETYNIIRIDRLSDLAGLDIPAVPPEQFTAPVLDLAPSSPPPMALI